MNRLTRQISEKSKRLIILLVSILLFLVGLVLTIFSFTIQDPLMQAVLLLLGTNICITIFLSYLYQATVKYYDNVDVENRLSAVIDQKLDTVFTDSMHFGLGGFERSINFSNIFDSLRAGETLWWLDTFDPKYHDWLYNLKKCLKRGANVNILMMSPNSSMIRFRADELGELFDQETFRQHLKAFKMSLDVVVESNKKKKLKGELQIVEYMDLPCAPIYLITDPNGTPFLGYSSMFLGRPTAVRFPHIIWKKTKEGFLHELHQYLVQKWVRNQSDLYKISNRPDTSVASN